MTDRQKCFDMKVRIKEAKVDYFSDYPEGWHVSSGDYYKFPVTINDAACFIKRFEKKNPLTIQGWKLLQSLKHKNHAPLPLVYDIVEETENGVKVYYVFYEYIQGQTLDRPVSLRMQDDLRRLTDDVMKGLEMTHRLEYWLSDFCEKNIFWDKDGRFLLIDLDSAYPATDRPMGVMEGSKEFWVYVLEFYRRQLQRRDMRMIDIYGPSLNYLQLIFLILKSKWKLVHKTNADHPETREWLIGQLAVVAPDAPELFVSMANTGDQLPEQDILDRIKAIADRIVEAKDKMFSASPVNTKNGGQPAAGPGRKEKDRRPKGAGEGSKERNQPAGEAGLHSKETTQPAGEANLRLKERTRPGGEPDLRSKEREKSAGEVGPRSEETGVRTPGPRRRSTKPALDKVGQFIRSNWKSRPVMLAGAAILAILLLWVLIPKLNHLPHITTTAVYQDSFIIVRWRNYPDLQNISVSFDGKEARQKKLSGDEFEVTVPELPAVRATPVVRVVIKGPGDKTLLSTKMDYVAVAIQGIKADILFEDSTLTISGKRLDSKALAVFFNRVRAPVVSASFDTLVVRVPDVGDRYITEDIADVTMKVQLQVRLRDSTVLFEKLGELKESRIGLIHYMGTTRVEGYGQVRTAVGTAEDGLNYRMLRMYPSRIRNGGIRAFVRPANGWFHLPAGKKQFRVLLGYALNTDITHILDIANFQAYIHFANDGKEMVRQVVDTTVPYNPDLTVVRGDFPSLAGASFFVELRVNPGEHPDNDSAIWVNPTICLRKIVFDN